MPEMTIQQQERSMVHAAMGAVNQAGKNIDEWGMQSASDLIHAMTEELGEVARAHLQSIHEDKARERVREETIHLAALCLQLCLREEAETDV